jgi:hypothetical protein
MYSSLGTGGASSTAAHAHTYPLLRTLKTAEYIVEESIHFPRKLTPGPKGSDRALGLRHDRLETDELDLDHSWSLPP